MHLKRAGPEELKAMAEGCRKYTEELTQIILDDLKEIAPLLNLHEDGHIALGYSSWAAYCGQEFHKVKHEHIGCSKLRV